MATAPGAGARLATAQQAAPTCPRVEPNYPPEPGVNDSGKQTRLVTRVKTGCTTCRQRRIKCDETKPVCKKCLASRLICVGALYESSQAGNTRSRPLPLPGVCQPAPPTCPAQIKDRQDEIELFHYFRSEVASQLAGELDVEFWTINVLRHAQTQPVLWYACNAIAATHMKERIGLTSRQPVTGKEKALEWQPYRQYHFAIQHLKRLLKKPHQSLDDKEDIVVANFLFAILGLLRGDWAECSTHLTNCGQLLNILKILQQTRDYRTHDKDSLHTADSLVYLSIRFDSILSHMRTPEYKEDPGIPNRVPRWRDSPFISITDAYLQLELIFNYTTDIILTPGPDASFWDEIHIGFMSWHVGGLRRQLDKWEVHFKELILRQAGRDTIALKLLELRLKLLRLIMRAKDFGTPNELCWDSFTGEFLILVEAAKNILVMRYNALSNSKSAPQQQQTATFTVTPMMKDALYIISRVCRDSRIRRRIAALSDHDYFLSPDIDTPTYIAMARAIIDIEETGWREASRLQRFQSSCGCSEAAQFICDGHRVRCTCLEAATGNHATLWVKTVHDVYNNRAWAKIQIEYGSYKPALVPLAEI